VKPIPLIIATALLATPAVAGERQVGSWTVAEAADPITKLPWAAAVINNNSDGTALHIDCARGRAFMSVWTHRHRYFEGDRVAVVYRIDDNEPMISEWNNDIGTGMAYAGISRATYSKLANAKTIAIQLFFKSTHREESIITVFKAVKTEEALRPILTECPIENANEKSASRLFRPNEPYFQEPAAFVEEWKENNELCQNGNSIEKPTADACKSRLSLETKLKSLGCSFNHGIGEWACKK
jgi:hypothetical protein